MHGTPRSSSAAVSPASPSATPARRRSRLFRAFLPAMALLAASCLRPSEEVAGPDDRALTTLPVAALITGFSESQVVSGLSQPTAMQFAPDGRLFVCEQGGRLRVVKNGALLATPFLTVATQNTGERGLLGVAFDPDYATTRHVYVYYTATSPNIHNRLSRFTASSTNPDVAAAGETVLLDLDPLSSATNHNGGAIHFGADGKLYVAVGDNASGANAQNMGTLHGKLLRLNRDGTIPADNPFYSTASGKYRSIWALGLRNPFTFAVQPGTGRIHINDVGQSSWEEINVGASGANYGWPATEGYTSDSRYRSPWYAYGRGDGCAITGGVFYNPAVPHYPAEYVGDYFFADYCNGWIRRRDIAGGAPVGFQTGLSSVVDLKVGPDGALYYLARGGGVIRRIVYTGSQAPSITSHPASRTAAPGASVSFTVAATGTAPLSYRWQRDGVDIPGATSATYTLGAVQASDNGARFRAIVSNAAGSATSDEAVLTVTGDLPPTGTIETPAAGTTFRGGQTIAYSGTASDPETGALPGSAFTWRVDLHHDTHTHPLVAPVTGSASGTFTVPDRGETSSNVWYRIHLTVTDPAGSTHSSWRDIQPVKVSVTLASNPAGLQLTLDGQPVTTPYTFTGVAGMIRVLGAPSPQTLGATTYRFSSWSDGGAATHEVATPGTDASVTAVFAVSNGTVYQAEAAARSGAVVASNQAGYTGTGFVDYINASGDYVEWTVNAPSAGVYRLDFRYALASGSRPLAIRVNGAVAAASQPFPSTGAWTAWGVSGLNATLQAGANTVRATAIGSSGPNLDYLAVK